MSDRAQTMLAAVVHGPGDVRVESVPVPVPAADEALISVRAANICPSDLREYRGIKPQSAPFQPGHEVAGVVLEVGQLVRSLAPGDRVVAMSWTPCLHCRECRRGYYSACESRLENMGGFAEAMCVKEWALLPVPAACSFEKAACTEPLGSIVKAQTKVTPVRGGDAVVVAGLGPMGILHAQLAGFLGAGRVIGIDTQASRRELAADLGCEIVIDPAVGDVVEQVKAATDGLGADLSLVTVGGAAEPACVADALRYSAHGARVNIFAGTYPPGTLELDPNVVHYRELTVTGTRSYDLESFQLALQLIAEDQLDVLAIRFPDVTLEGIAEGFDIHGSAEAMKVGVSFDEIDAPLRAD